MAQGFWCPENASSATIPTGSSFHNARMRTGDCLDGTNAKARTLVRMNSDKELEDIPGTVMKASYKFSLNQPSKDD